MKEEGIIIEDEKKDSKCTKCCKNCRKTCKSHFTEVGEKDYKYILVDHNHMSDEELESSNIKKERKARKNWLKVTTRV